MDKSLEFRLLIAAKEMFEILEDTDHDCRFRGSNGEDHCRGCEQLLHWRQIINSAEINFQKYLDSTKEPNDPIIDMSNSELYPESEEENE